MEEDHKKVELASAEQLTEVRRLNEILKTTEEEKDKHYGWANVTSYKDMPSDKIAVVIERLTSKINKGA
jgi:flagellar motility protein MotE (MotC chaperone)